MEHCTTCGSHAHPTETDDDGGNCMWCRGLICEVCEETEGTVRDCCGLRLCDGCADMDGGHGEFHSLRDEQSSEANADYTTAEAERQWELRIRERTRDGTLDRSEERGETTTTVVS